MWASDALSTPSLGITFRLLGRVEEFTRFTFQLPLSGSRDGGIEVEIATSHELSTPSLGITA